MGMAFWRGPGFQVTTQNSISSEDPKGRSMANKLNVCAQVLHSANSQEIGGIAMATEEKDCNIKSRCIAVSDEEMEKALDEDFRLSVPGMSKRQQGNIEKAGASKNPASRAHRLRKTPNTVIFSQKVPGSKTEEPKKRLASATKRKASGIHETENTLKGPAVKKTRQGNVAEVTGEGAVPAIQCLHNTLEAIVPAIQCLQNTLDAIKGMAKALKKCQILFKSMSDVMQNHNLLPACVASFEAIKNYDGCSFAVVNPKYYQTGRGMFRKSGRKKGKYWPKIAERLVNRSKKYLLRRKRLSNTVSLNQMNALFDCKPVDSP